MTASQYQAARRFLAKIDADWAQLVKQVGPCRFEPKAEREPYDALVRAVAYQQLHGKAAAAILGRLLALNRGCMPKPKKLLALEFEQLRGCGFSARKIETLQGIAEATLTGQVPSRARAVKMTDNELIEQLSELKGIGRWTVEMLLMFTLERMDVLPVDDFGIRDGYRRLKNLAAPPSPRALRDIGAAWSPHRTIASWYLWQVPR